MNMWEILEDIRKNCCFVELSHEVSEKTPHWSGFPDMRMKEFFNYEHDGFYANQFEMVSQYGTHVDAPSHFIKGKRMLHEINAKEMILPLCVINISEKAAENCDYAATVDDVKDWEDKHGKIPAQSFAALRTDWSKRDDLDNFDASGNKHYPGWSLEAIQYLVEKRNVAAIGHETSDTDPPAIPGYKGEAYLLNQNRYQIELLKNLDLIPEAGAVIICGFPRVINGSGFTARCIAVFKKD